MADNQSTPADTSPAESGPALGWKLPCLPFEIEPLYWLLLALPVAIAFRIWNVYDHSTWIYLGLFITSCLALLPLAGLMGRATENLAETLGSGIGGLLNATFGNAAELIIALLLLFHNKYDVVKASLTGSILGNVLLVLGLAILVGGCFHKKQTFNRTAAGLGATLLGLAAIGLLVPTMHYHLFPHTAEQRHTITILSEEIALLLIVVYVLSLLFSLRTHQHLFAGEEAELPTTGEHHQPEWSRATSLIILLLSTIGVAVAAEFLVHSVDRAAEAIHLHPLFIGVIVVAVIGNAAEHSTAVLVAAKNKMDLAVNIAIGSSIQIALFVAPVLVFASLLTGHGVLDLRFTALETAALLIAVAVVALIAQDGETHWMEGVMLLAVYLMIALTFLHLPKTPGAGH